MTTTQESEVSTLDKQNTQVERPVAPIVGALAREQIMKRLGEAVQIVRREGFDDLGRLRDVLNDVTDRVDALELACLAAGRAGHTQPCSRFTAAALATARGEPVGEFLLVPFGEVVVERPITGEDFAFTRSHAESAKRWFDQMGRKLAIDYEHQSFERLNSRPDGLRPAAGWIGGLEVRADGLWAVDVSWTGRARELLRSGEYRYFSPVIFWTDEDQSDVAALGPVALTNDPAMRGVAPLAAARQAQTEEPSGESTEDEVSAGEPNQVLEEEEELESALDGELESARTEIALLRRQLAAQEADTFVERGMRLGKILDSTSIDWRDDYQRDPEAAEARLERAPVLLPPGRAIALDRRGRAQRVPRGGSGNRDVAATVAASDVQAEDLAAYERAAAAGRVLGAGLLVTAATRPRVV